MGGDLLTTSEDKASALEGLTAISTGQPPARERQTLSQHCLARLMKDWTLTLREEMCRGSVGLQEGQAGAGRLPQVRGRMPALELEQPSNWILIQHLPLLSCVTSGWLLNSPRPQPPYPAKAPCEAAAGFSNTHLGMLVR